VEIAVARFVAENPAKGLPGQQRIPQRMPYRERSHHDHDGVLRLGMTLFRSIQIAEMLVTS